MVAAEDASNFAQRLGIQKDQVVQELGWDEDVDDDIRADIEEACGGELLDEDADEVIDVVLLWWRDDDGDLVDRLMDAITPLADDGVIWVVTPKTGKPGHQRKEGGEEGSERPQNRRDIYDHEVAVVEPVQAGDAERVL